MKIAIAEVKKREGWTGKAVGPYPGEGSERTVGIERDPDNPRGPAVAVILDGITGTIVDYRKNDPKAAEATQAWNELVRNETTGRKGSPTAYDSFRFRVPGQSCGRRAQDRSFRATRHGLARVGNSLAAFRRARSSRMPSGARRKGTHVGVQENRRRLETRSVDSRRVGPLCRRGHSRLTDWSQSAAVRAGYRTAPACFGSSSHLAVVDSPIKRASIPLGKRDLLPLMGQQPVVDFRVVVGGGPGVVEGFGVDGEFGFGVGLLRGRRSGLASVSRARSGLCRRERPRRVCF